MTTGIERVAAAGILDDELWRVFAATVQHDTGVRAGEYALVVDDHRVESFMYEVAVPLLESYGMTTRVDEANNVVATFGPLTGSELLFVTYPVNHHGNTTPEPLSARSSIVGERTAWVGLGASQGKGALASVCAALDAATRDGVQLDGRIAVAVCSEGSSTHASSAALYKGLARRPAGAIVAVGTENRLCTATRGRVDISVVIHGRAVHTSSARVDENPIPVVRQVLEKIAEMTPSGEPPHPFLGMRRTMPYRLVCGPVYPHTTPECIELTLDCRTLPGDDPAALVAQCEVLLRGLPVTVRQGATMLPAQVATDSHLVASIQQAGIKAMGFPLEICYPSWTFDAGYACSIGVPAVTFGPSSSDVAGSQVTGLDFVHLDDLRSAAAVYAALMRSEWRQASPEDSPAAQAP